MDAAGRLPRADQPIADIAIARLLRAAAKITIRKAQRFQPIPHTINVDLRAIVRSTGERELLIRQPICRRRTTFDQRQRLQHFARRARKDQCCWITPSLHNVTGGISHNRVALMQTFQHLAAPNLDEIYGAIQGLC